MSDIKELEDQELDETSGGLCDPATWVKLGEKFKEILGQKDKPKKEEK